MHKFCNAEYISWLLHDCDSKIRNVCPDINRKVKSFANYVSEQHLFATMFINAEILFSYEKIWMQQLQAPRIPWKLSWKTLIGPTQFTICGPTV